MTDDALDVLTALHETYVVPEVQRRFASGSPTDFRIKQCLVLISTKWAPIVYFNEEVVFTACAKAAPGTQVHESMIGTRTSSEGLGALEYVLHPVIDDVPVDYIYFKVEQGLMTFLADRRPNLPSFVPDGNPPRSDLLLLEMNYQSRAMAVGALSRPENEQALRDVGLWIVPRLCHQPMRHLAKLARHGRRADVEHALLDHCTDDFIEGVTTEWIEVPLFGERSNVLKQAVQAMRHGLYSLVVPALLPHVEGVITEWLYARLPADDVGGYQKEKLRKFTSLVTTAEGHFAGPEFSAIRDVALDVFNTALFGRFDWLGPLSDTMLNRHVVGHGKVHEPYETRLAAVKAFLLLDTLHHMIREMSPDWKAQALMRDGQEVQHEGHPVSWRFVRRLPART